MRLRTQVLGLVALGALATALNLVVTVGLGVAMTRWGDARDLNREARERWTECAARPETWSVSRRGFVAFAYDPVTHVSLNPRARPYDEVASYLGPPSWTQSMGDGPCGEIVMYSEFEQVYRLPDRTVDHDPGSRRHVHGHRGDGGAPIGHEGGGAGGVHEHAGRGERARARARGGA